MPGISLRSLGGYRSDALWPAQLEALVIHEKAERRGAVGDVISMAEDFNLPIQRVQRRILDDLANNGNHQGLALRVGPFPYATSTTSWPWLPSAARNRSYSC